MSGVSFPGHGAVSFCGNEFCVVHTSEGVRTVLRKGRQRFCWHFAPARLSAMVLAGIDAQVLAAIALFCFIAGTVA